MRIAEVSQSKMVKVWHVTQKRKVPQILQQGLVPKIGKSSRSAREKSAAIYVFPDWTSLIDGLTNWLADETPYRLSILELLVPGDWLKQHAVRWEASIEQPVPASMIRVLIPDIDEWDSTDYPA